MKLVPVTLLALTVAAVGWAAPASAPRLLIPAAASTNGLAGSHWRTDLVIHNPSAVPAEVMVELIPSGFSGGLADPQWVVLPELLEPNRDRDRQRRPGDLLPRARHRRPGGDREPSHRAGRAGGGVADLDARARRGRHARPGHRRHPVARRRPRRRGKGAGRPRVLGGLPHQPRPRQPDLRLHPDLPGRDPGCRRGGGRQGLLHPAAARPLPAQRHPEHIGSGRRRIHREGVAGRLAGDRAEGGRRAAHSSAG